MFVPHHLLVVVGWNWLSWPWAPIGLGEMENDGVSNTIVKYVQLDHLVIGLWVDATASGERVVVVVSTVVVVFGIGIGGEGDGYFGENADVYTNNADICKVVATLISVASGDDDAHGAGSWWETRTGAQRIGTVCVGRAGRGKGTMVLFSRC